MQRTKAKISVLFLTATAAVACILHFLQLREQESELLQTDDGNTAGSYLIYLLIFLGFIFSVLYASSKKDLTRTFDFENGSGSIFSVSGVLALTFFYDFIHQGYNCYAYVSNVSYVEYTYVILLAITGVFALLSCFYFITVALTAKNVNYDFTNFTLLHFVPVIWAFIKLFTIMLKIVDIRVNLEVSCEFILLCSTLCFLFSMISAIDKKDAQTTGIFVFSSVMLSFMSCVVGLPRIAMIFTGGEGVLTQVTFSAVTYIMLGVFSAALLCDVNKRSQ